MADMIAVMNTIRANASQDYQTRIPQATKDNLTDLGSKIMSYAPTQNEFLNALVNRIAMVIVHNKTFKNPLSVLKKGTVPMGKNIEEIYTNPAIGSEFDATGTTLLNRVIPDTKAIYHAQNRKGKYKATISQEMLVQAFTSYDDLNKLLSSIINSIYSGDNMDEFLLTKNLFASAIDGNKIVTIDVDEVTDQSTAKGLVKAIKKVSKGMALPSTTFNSYHTVNPSETAVTTWTPIEDQIMIINNDVSVELDVEMFAQAFNVDYVTFNTRSLYLDTFGATKECYAILCDKSYVQVYDNLYQMRQFQNGEGLYDNYMLHHWQTYSLSLFANAVAFTKKEVE